MRLWRATLPPSDRKFPVEDGAIRARLLDEVLGYYAQDNVKARRLLIDGRYAPLESNAPTFRSQLVLLDAAKRSGEPKTLEPVIRHLAAPERSPEPLRSASLAG